MRRYYNDEYDPSSEDYDLEFKCQGSALRAATRRNPRNLPCPTCKEPNRLTPKDRAQGYQCDSCADRDEGGWGY